jgi:hypothetical protein
MNLPPPYPHIKTPPPGGENLDDGGSDGLPQPSPHNQPDTEPTPWLLGNKHGVQPQKKIKFLYL